MTPLPAANYPRMQKLVTPPPKKKQQQQKKKQKKTNKKTTKKKINRKQIYMYATLCLYFLYSKYLICIFTKIKDTYE